MHLDFKTHKRNKRFPFGVIGLFFLGSLLFLIIFSANKNISLSQIITRDATKPILDIFYFVFILLNLFFFIFSISVIKKLRGALKAILSISLFGYTLYGMILAYFYEVDYFITAIRIYYILALLFFIIYVLTFLFQNRSFSKYNNKIVLLFASLAIIPLFIINYYIVKDLSFTNIVLTISNYVYTGTLASYVISNSIYIHMLNKRM